MTGLVAFLRFEVLRLMRNPRYVAITIGFPVIFYSLFLHSLQPAVHIAGTPWHTYFMVSMASFGAMVAALNAGGTRLASERASGWTRQLRVTPLPAWSYITTKMAASMIIALPVICLVEVTGLLVGGVRLGLGAWALLTLVRRAVHPGQQPADSAPTRGVVAAELPRSLARVGRGGRSRPRHRRCGVPLLLRPRPGGGRHVAPPRRGVPSVRLSLAGAPVGALDVLFQD